MKNLMPLLLMGITVSGWSQQQESLVFRERIHNFGDVEEKGGNVEYEFSFTNISALPVKILSVQATCGCTTPAWSQNPIPPGKTGFIKASFDPSGRPGHFNKALTVITDRDPNPIMLQIQGTVTTITGNEKIEFVSVVGNLALVSRSFNFDKIYINREPVVKIFPIMNVGQEPIELIKYSGPLYLKVEMPFVIGPKAKGVIKVTYDTRKKNAFGFASDNIQIETNDPGSEVKLIQVFATLEEFYPVPTPEEAKKGPILFIKEPSIDLGRFAAGEKIERVVSIANNGKKELQIKALQGNCTCIWADAEKKLISKGDSTHIKITFQPQNRGGTQMKAITIYSNDPLNSVQRINVQAFIED